MNDDERAICAMVDRWMAASAAGDNETVLSLLADDVIFSVPGRTPFGKAEFAAAAGAMRQQRFEGRCDIQEIAVLGDWAYMRNHIDAKLTLPDGTARRHAGYTLTVLRRNSDGGWVISRDANLILADQPI